MFNLSGNFPERRSEILSLLLPHTLDADFTLKMLQMSPCLDRFAMFCQKKRSLQDFVFLVNKDPIEDNLLATGGTHWLDSCLKFA